MAATTFMLSSIVATRGERDPIIAEAAVANDGQKPRGNQLAQWPLAVERETLAQ